MGSQDLSGRAVLRGAIAGQRRDVATGALLGAGHQAGEALVPVVIGVVIDRGVADGDLTGLVLGVVALGVIYLGLSFSFRFGARAGERAAETSAHRLRTRLVGRILAPEDGAPPGRLSGELTNIATLDAKRVGSVCMALVVGISALMGLLVSAVVLVRISALLGLVVLLGTPLLLWLGHLLSKPLEHRSGAEQERAAHASGVAADLVSGLRVLKGIGAEPAAVARYRTTSRHSLAATLRAARAQAWQSGIVLSLTGVFIALVAFIGGRLATAGDISLGELVSAVGLALFLLGPLSQFSWVNAELAQGRASAARIAEVLTTDGTTLPGADTLPPCVQGRLRLRAVSHETLRGVDMDIAAGEVVGVVTTDPSDANALLGCLARRFDPDSGAVELDGVPLSTLHPAAIRTAVLVAEHDADLFEGTLLSNVAAAAGSADTVERAIVASGADEVARTLHRGAYTTVTERGRSLSGGQRQRVALARALAVDAPVLVLHDPATAVDAVTEAKIAAGLREIRAGRTTVVLTTSPALLAMTDRVIFIEGGRVLAAAPHGELASDHLGYRTAVLS
ncbi:ABC transporter ATP-binding protein [Streptomyces sp. NPDC056500]|uniref:ABC transporter ATP-binding protein n=1 Tax=Streptomyces sp. NPDC056500 TaxID=3345840 RepID=UPI0036A4C486